MCFKIDRSKLVVVSLAVLMLSSVFVFGSAAAAQNSNSLFSMFGSLFSSIGNAARTITGYQVSEGGGGEGSPDLAISDVNVYPVSPSEGAEVVFEVLVKNVGTASTTDYTFSYDFGDGVGGGASQLSVAAGGAKYEKITHVYKAAGAYTAAFSVKTSNDADTSNNIVSKQIIVLAAPALTPAPTPVVVKEQVNCMFVNSASQQKCYSNDGRFSCAGVGTCLADVSGDNGAKLTWKSSCGGYAYTVIDGSNENAEFKCELAPTPAPTPTPAPVCKDSDGGSNYYVKGVSSDGKADYGDYCSGNVLAEKYCSGDAQVVTEEYNCPYGCNDGACLPSGGGAGCVRANPSVTISPSHQETAGVEKVAYKVTVVNKDNAACGPSVFRRGGTSEAAVTTDYTLHVTDEYGDKDLPAISPGSSLTFNLYASFSAGAKPGTYYPGMLVENYNDISYLSRAKATLLLASSPEVFPDVAVTKIDLRESYAVAGRYTSVTATISNFGTSFGVYNLMVDFGDGSNKYFMPNRFNQDDKENNRITGGVSIKPGGVSTEMASHNYSMPGTYTITAEVAANYDTNRANDKLSKTIVVGSPAGCRGGACQEEVPVEACPSRIEFTFDKSHYKIGEPYTVKVATYGSSGNLAGADLDVTTERDGKVQTSTVSTRPSGARTDSGTISSTLVGSYVYTLKSKPSCQNVVTAVQKIVISGEITIGGCTDSDGGMNYYKQGYMNVSYEGPGGSGYWDSCNDANELVEHYCDSSGKKRTTYYCPNGCKDGACLSEAAVACPAKIEFAFDESTYVVEETFKSKLATYDEKGNLVGTDLAHTFEKNGKMGQPSMSQASVTTKPSGVLWQSGYFGEPGTYVYTYASMPSCKNIVTASQKINVVEGTEGKCSDSDSTYAVTLEERSRYNPPGDDRFVKGTVSYAGKTFEDYCVNQVHYTDSGGNKVIRYDNVNQGEIIIEQACLDGRKYYEATPYPCPNGCRDGACLRSEPSVKPPEAPKDVPKEAEVPEGKYVYGVQIKKGWNLISLIPFFLTAQPKAIVQGKGAPSGQPEQEESGPGTVSITCSWAKDEQYSRENVFGYDSINKRYIRLGELGSMTAPDLNKGSYLVNTPVNSFWLRSTEDCTISMDFGTSAGMFKMLGEISKNGYKLVKGWNFFIVLPEMEGKTLDDIKGSCEIKRAYAYDQFSRKWTKLEGVEFSRSAVSYGFVMKVTDDCVLGESSVISLPPPLPEEDKAEVVAATTAKQVEKAPTVTTQLK